MADRRGDKLPRWLFFAALLLPLGTLIAGIVRAERHLTNSTQWLFEITGYDPRDLLRGHYIQFRLKLPEQAPVSSQCGPTEAETCCYCLERRSEAPVPRMTRMTCNEAALCDGRLNTQRAAELRRFYVSEARAPELEAQLREAARAGNAHVVLAIDSHGTPQIVELRVDGVAVERQPPAR